MSKRDRKPPGSPRQDAGREHAERAPGAAPGIEAPPDEELIAGARRGSQDAYRRLYERYYRRIFQLAVSMVYSREDAEDIAQQTFIQAFRSLGRFRGQSSFYTWLYRIALNAATDYRRKLVRRERRGPTESLDEDGPAARQLAAPPADGPEQALYHRELNELVRRALETLSQEHRQVLILREIGGLSYGEIAEATGANAGTVMSRLHYARKALAETLRRWNVNEAESET